MVDSFEDSNAVVVVVGSDIMAMAPDTMSTSVRPTTTSDSSSLLTIPLEIPMMLLLLVVPTTPWQRPLSSSPLVVVLLPAVATAAATPDYFASKTPPFFLFGGIHPFHGVSGGRGNGMTIRSTLIVTILVMVVTVDDLRPIGECFGGKILVLLLDEEVLLLFFDWIISGGLSRIGV